MNKWIAIALVTGSLAGCGGHKGDSPETKMKEFEGYRDKMCACTEATCAEKVLADWREWRKGTKDLKLSDDLKQKSKEVNAAFWECKRKVAPGDESE